MEREKHIQSSGDPIGHRYPMTKEKSGNVYVFNHVTFDNSSLGVRYGSVRDCSYIEKTFKSLKFDVIIYHDLIYSVILQTLLAIAEMDLGCVVIFVLTHGINGMIFAKDIEYYPDVFWKMLNNHNSKLVLKPKLIFIQAPRGDETNDENHKEMMFPIPNVPDILLMYSCYDEFSSWKNFVTGSWFIVYLCNELKHHANNTDVATLLTYFNKRAPIYYITRTCKYLIKLEQ